MQIQEAVETCVAKKYANFTDTATRSEFWWFVLFLFVVNALLGIVSHSIAAIFAVAMLVPYIAVGVRRLRDTGRSPWWWLIALVPLIGAIVLIVFWAQEGSTPTTPT